MVHLEWYLYPMLIIALCVSLRLLDSKAAFFGLETCFVGLGLQRSSKINIRCADCIVMFISQERDLFVAPSHTSRVPNLCGGKGSFCSPRSDLKARAGLLRSHSLHNANPTIGASS